MDFNFLKIVWVICVLSILPGCCLEQQGLKTDRLDNLFFAMDTGTGSASFAEQAEMLKELGYAGIAYTVPLQPKRYEGLPEMLGALEKCNLRLFAIYENLWIDDPEPGCPAKLKKAMALMKGHDSVIWLAIKSKKFKSYSQQADNNAVKLVRAVADEASKFGLEVSLYPHYGFYLQTIEDTLRIVTKADKENVTMTFNLCHWLKTEKGKGLNRLIKLSMPYLTLVTINGADNVQPGRELGWNRLIQPLDKGSFDTYGFLKTLKENGYDNPIGLQGYGIKGSAGENLRRSMKAWRQFCNRYTIESELE